MPAARKSAENFGKYVGDIRTHIMRISLDPNDEMFSPDGKFATGKLTADFACLSCHAGRDKAWATAKPRGFTAGEVAADCRSSRGHHECPRGFLPGASGIFDASSARRRDAGFSQYISPKARGFAKFAKRAKICGPSSNHGWNSDDSLSPE